MLEVYLDPCTVNSRKVSLEISENDFLFLLFLELCPKYTQITCIIYTIRIQQSSTNSKILIGIGWTRPARHSISFQPC